MNIKTYLCLALFATCAFAKEAPVDSTTVIGHWKLASVTTNDAKVLEKALAGHKELDFRKDGTVANVCPTGDGKTITLSGTYRVEAGQIFVKIDGKEEPAKAAVRDDALIIFPPGGPVTELIFQKVK